MYHPLRSLREGNWFKLICGASFQHLPAVRNLTLAYALAGADCIDVAADPAVISAARDALQIAADLRELAQARGFQAVSTPWLMVSLNDGEDPHFRKATFDPLNCPTDCSRPCERICPAQAIVFEQPDASLPGTIVSGTSGSASALESNVAASTVPNGAPKVISGVIDSRCYGCGRCLPVCPIQHIATRSYVSTPAAIAPLVLSGVDAVEIHTQVGRLDEFQRLWTAIAPFTPNLKLIAISCPDGNGLLDYLWSLYDLISPLSCSLIWQTDGRPMSGDIGDGTTRAAVKLGQKVLAAGLPGYVQLAGGTNSHTIAKLNTLGLLNQTGIPSSGYISGVAYGSYARVLLSPILEQLEEHVEQWRTESQESDERRQAVETASPLDPQSRVATPRLEDNSNLLWQAVSLANSLVSQLKSPMTLKQTVPK